MTQTISCPGGCGRTYQVPPDRYCHACDDYLEDLQAAAEGCTTDVSPAARATIPDTRLEDQRKADARPVVEALGWRVRDFEQGWRPKACRKCGEKIPAGGSTRVPLGVGDWYVTRDGVGAWLEWKTDDNHQTDGQRAFQAECEEDGIPYAVVRNTDEAVRFLENLRARRAA